MTRNTIIREKHVTHAGEVEVEISISVSGPGDGVANIDQDLIEHIKERRPQSIANPIAGSQTQGSVSFFAPVVKQSFGSHLASEFSEVDREKFFSAQFGIPHQHFEGGQVGSAAEAKSNSR